MRLVLFANINRSMRYYRPQNYFNATNDELRHENRRCLLSDAIVHASVRLALPRETVIYNNADL